ncbi:hypothetical protein, partial [Streptomyces sp. NRRL S-495]|uniref:hypothetical protein n=1 Tax=Streptomyces sp. NRRL S-495 TaxID=1609133 RepID=UPI00256FFBA9
MPVGTRAPVMRASSSSPALTRVVTGVMAAVVIIRAIPRRWLGARGPERPGNAWWRNAEGPAPGIMYAVRAPRYQAGA